MKKVLLTVFLVLVVSSITFAQSTIDWNYQPFPNLPFQIDHIELDLNVDTELPLIKGTGTFNFTSRRPDLTTVIFHTADLDIKEVSKEGNPLDFEVSNDSLIIQLEDTLGVKSNSQFLITWESSSPYAFHKDVSGNVWTSLNPKARHHWFPIVDHPEVAATFDVSFIIPAEKSVIFNGNFVRDEVISTGEKKVEWATETAIPISGLTFSVGNFVTESARSGIKEISLSANKDEILEEVRSGLLSVAVQTFKDYEKKFSFEFPYGALNVVVLPDNRWEEIQSGAGMIYLYQNLGSLSTQLKRGMATQWFGNYHRYLNTPDHRFEFLKTLVTRSSETDQLQNPDNLKSISYWNRWQKGMDEFEDQYMIDTIEETLPKLIQEFTGVTNWQMYAGFWYDRTGSFWNEIPLPSTTKTTITEQYNYDVRYIYDEMTNSLSLVFETDGNPVETLVGVEVNQFGFMDTTQTEITFTGAYDSVSVDIASGIDYITLSPQTDLALEFDEQKPFLFLIRQLRSSNAEVQIQAAIKLRKFTDNPDLQLALQDVLQSEIEPKARAAMLETLSIITKGASGTEQNFLDQLNSDDLSTQLTAVRALVNYPGNDQVAYAIRNSILEAESDTLFEATLKTYKEIAGTEDLLSITQRLERNLQGQKKALKILQITAALDTTNKSITIADRFALGNFPYQIRKQALTILINYEVNQDYWNQTIEMLLEDRDPRIRFHALDAIKFLSPKQTVDVLKSRIEEEMDPRVMEKIRRVM
jgi:hypothetical protein